MVIFILTQSVELMVKRSLKDILYKKKVNITVFHNIFITKISIITLKKIFISSFICTGK